MGSELKVNMSDLNTLVRCLDDKMCVPYILQKIYSNNKGVRWNLHGRDVLRKLNGGEELLSMMDKGEA